jgi:hypothetical protein
MPPWPEIEASVLPVVREQLGSERSIKVYLLRQRLDAPQHHLAYISASYPCANGFLGVRHPWGDNNGVVALADLSEGQNGIDLDLLYEHYDVFFRKISPLRYIRALEAGETPSHLNRLLDFDADDPHTFSFRYEP